MWCIARFKDWTSKRWGNPVDEIHTAELEIKRLIEKRTLMKSQLRDMPALIEAQFDIINKAKEKIK
jgi:hypothetical protein